MFMHDHSSYTRSEMELVGKIADRAIAGIETMAGRAKIEIIMDLLAVHQVMGLRLADLLAADAFDFAHDICGIARYLNRHTGQLEGWFLPRFIKPQTETHNLEAAQ